MASRQEEKERRRAERVAREQAEATAHARKRRLGIVAGGVLGAAAIAAVVIAVVASGGGTKHGTNGPKATGGGNIKNVAIPAVKETDLAAAAKLAGCTMLSPKSEGRGHVDTKVTYRSNPPTSGPHSPNAASDGIYGPGDTPPAENYIHALEHGRVVFQYKPGTPVQVIGQLQSLVDEIQTNGNPRVMLFENDTGMPYTVAATAWTHLIGCDKVTPATWDALRAFQSRYDLKAPETQFVGPE